MKSELDKIEEYESEFDSEAKPGKMSPHLLSGSGLNLGSSQGSVCERDSLNLIREKPNASGIPIKPQNLNPNHKTQNLNAEFKPLIQTQICKILAR